MFEGVRGRGRPGAQPALDEDVRQVPGDCLVTDDQSLGDLAVAATSGDQG